MKSCKNWDAESRATRLSTSRTGLPQRRSRDVTTRDFCSQSSSWCNTDSGFPRDDRGTLDPPRAALTRLDQGELPMVFPTIKTIESLSLYESSRRCIGRIRKAIRALNHTNTCGYTHRNRARNRPGEVSAISVCTVTQRVAAPLVS